MRSNQWSSQYGKICRGWLRRVPNLGLATEYLQLASRMYGAFRSDYFLILDSIRCERGVGFLCEIGNECV